MTTRPEIPQPIEGALTLLLEYLYVQEQRDYKENKQNGHIFHSLLTVAEWIGWEPE